MRSVISGYVGTTRGHMITSAPPAPLPLKMELINRGGN